MMLALVARAIANDSGIDCQSNLEYDKSIINYDVRQLRHFPEMKTATSCFLGTASSLINDSGKSLLSYFCMAEKDVALADSLQTFVDLKGQQYIHSKQNVLHTNLLALRFL